MINIVNFILIKKKIGQKKKEKDRKSKPENEMGPKRLHKNKERFSGGQGLKNLILDAIYFRALL